MKFALLVYEPLDAIVTPEHPERFAAYMAPYEKYLAELESAGVAAGGTALQTPTLATTVRLVSDRLHVQDGPYADTKEQFGGMFIIDVANIDEALKWAAKCPAAKIGAIEVRPVMDTP